MAESIYKKGQKDKYRKFIGTDILNYDNCRGYYFCKKRNTEIRSGWILQNGENNLYQPIKDSALTYFRDNGIKWWNLEDCKEDGTNPPTHVLSSQISCINHLFPLRNDKEAVLAIAQSIDKEFTDICILENDREGSRGYISFEVISKDEHLNENEEYRKRGEFCTSVDALILGIRKGRRTLIMLEWKYTETYEEKDLSKEDNPRLPKGNMKKGQTRLKNYSELIRSSSEIDSSKVIELQGSLFFYEPFYQLMRQTLWAEQMIKFQENEIIKADDYIHIHVIPSCNKDLLDNGFPQKGTTMEQTWRSVLRHQEKYRIMDPEELYSQLNSRKYEALKQYLKTRYWG